MTWHDVSDYYEVVLPKSGRQSIVETTAGKFRLTNMTDRDDLRDFVQTYATAARAKYWAMKGTRREDDWPQTFNSGPDRQFVVDLEGIEFDDGAQRVKVPWDKVTNYYVAPSQSAFRFDGSGRYTVVSTHGTFEFTHTTSRRRLHLLKEIIRRYASRAAADNWRPREGTHEDVIGGAASCWSGGLEGVGQRIYHYRTRLNRALLWMPTGFALAMVIRVYVYSQMQVSWQEFAPSKRPVNPLPGAVILGVLALWGWWRYYAAGVRTDKYGITQHSLLGKRSIPWEEVREYYVCGGEEFKFGNVVSATTRIWFHIQIADAEQLKSEIARCAPHTCTRTWEE